MIKTALRPKWVLFLLFVMALAAAFAWLGQWQLERAIEAAQPVDTESEIVVPLEGLLVPGMASTDKSGGHMAEITGYLDPQAYTLLTGRLNQGQAGYWVVGRMITSVDQASLPVALGWTESQDEAAAVLAELAAEPVADPTLWTGRFMPTEAPELPGTNDDPLSESTLSVASLVNQWPGYTGTVYSGYLINDTAPAGLEVIDSFAPKNEGSVNWLNIFYALEWIVFAGFAFYIWWRLVKDDYERQQDELELAASEVN
ncbi:surfeit locus 1 family protein [Aurantimicrobium minutum]|uniref:SURF1 family protein n=1 Tax=Aurantimicrobium minutum TaxID=708131 RepID=UPI0024770031|nr:SURF1 family cytochrome oxidase biogenesis protein [Aurantimicrobium minutum]MDH6532354.1 surfeit locus 1 family protein [Aurantimicrobium minutum]